MPIPAQNPATATIDFDSLLIRTLIYSGGEKFNLQLCRFASADGTIQSGSTTMKLVDDATAVAAIKTLLAQFIAARSIHSNFKALTINGSVNGTTIKAALRLITDVGTTVIQDCYAEAAKDATFAAILTAFVSAMTEYNAAAKVI